MSKIIEVNDGLQDFNCPWCGTTLEDVSNHTFHDIFNENCPICKGIIVIEITEVTILDYNVKKFKT